MNKALRTVLRDAENNVRLGQEMAEASAVVLQKRLEMLADAAANPLGADHGEIGLMSSEKVEAFSASAHAAGEAALNLSDSCLEIARRNSETVQSNLDALSREPSEASRLALQTEQIAQFWGQAMIDSIELWSQSLKAQADIIAPVHAAVVQNAERLK